jgi:DNA polymerase III, delta subunit
MSVEVRIIDLDSSTEAAQNTLLKVLEEPPPHCRFILIASRYPLPTIASRSRVYRMGLLSSEQVAQVLRECGATEHEAAMAAARGRGRVAPALDAIADKEADRVTSVVAAAIRAAAAGDLSAVLRNWTPEHTVVLAKWATEAASQRWVIFTWDFAPGVSRESALRLLYVLSTYQGTRTGAAVALDVLRERH